MAGEVGAPDTYSLGEQFSNESGMKFQGGTAYPKLLSINKAFLWSWGLKRIFRSGCGNTWPLERSSPG